MQPKIVFQNAIESPAGRIIAAGHERYRSFRQMPPMRVLDRYGFVYLLRGRGRFACGNGPESTVEAGDALLLFPGLAHSYEGAPWEEFWITFTGDAFDVWRRHGLLDPAKPILHLEPVAHWLRRLQQLVDGPPPRNAKQSLAQICRLQSVLADALLEDRRDPAAEKDSAWLASACSLLEADLPKPLDLTAVATRLGMSYQAFRKHFARVANVSPLKYRTRRLMDFACEFMHQNNATNKEMAERLGICDEYHFSRRFKQVTGMSPNQFRKHWRRNAASVAADSRKRLR